MKIYLLLSILTLAVSLVSILVLGRFADTEVLLNAVIYIDILIVAAFVLGILYMTTSNKATK